MIKIIFDYITSFFALIILSPIFIIIAFFIKIDSKGPVFFKQERVGKDGKLFIIYKFRTMIVNAVNKGHGISVVSNDPRITRVGSFLRKWSLDELPQLINILKGDMSLIGPRPTLEYQVKQYTDYMKRRLEVKPGITGLAQINGRKELTWEERIAYDIQYIDNWSIYLDFKIILRTILVLINRDGVYNDKNLVEFQQNDKTGEVDN